MTSTFLFFEDARRRRLYVSLLAIIAFLPPTVPLSLLAPMPDVVSLHPVSETFPEELKKRNLRRDSFFAWIDTLLGTIHFSRKDQILSVYVLFAECSERFYVDFVLQYKMNGKY